ncbi:hypothetical protein BUALT_Bualt03G0010300 [Buddleja alternifolia]|uniref:E3 ubiquitin-protein ligase LIN n=1 Tax=Buddleja alternifolia TaxID=168488 RepID=A0AAV6Y111_9LAMI|nr:hypothetical protein BUALT_Bualt03G0010300 [Buddleja alternifolia]
MASLHKLLSQEGFERQKSRKPRKKVKFKEQDSIALPIYICHDRRSFDSSRQKAENAASLKDSSVCSSRRRGSGSEISYPRQDEPAIDDVAIKAMISILSGYTGKYLVDKNFRKNIREKCSSCFDKRKNKHSDNQIFAHMEIGIQSIENLVENQEMKREMDLESLQNSIKIFNIVASLDSHSHPSACAHLYLSIVYKIAKDDKISAKHLLQVFNDSPFLGRTHLLPELWEHFFLPHLLHLKIWYNNELKFVASSDYFDKEKKIKALNEQYNGLMDIGTAKFALYYKDWLKVGGAQPPSIPSVPLPSKPIYARSRRRSSGSSTSHHSISNNTLYQAVFGTIMKARSMDLDNENGALKKLWDLEEEKEEVYNAVEEIKHCSHVEKKAVASHRRSSSQHYRTQKSELWPESRKPDYFRFLACRAEPTECFIQGNYMSNNEKIKNDENTRFFWLNDITKAIATICSSENLGHCEMAIRAVSKAWLSSNGDKIIETSLSQASVIQGIMEILYVSNDDEILELAISVLAELATKSEINRQWILNSDPRLDVLIRLLRSSSLFLKAAALLYLVKPKAKHMISVEWTPLVLRVLEFGDQLQILFTVRCSPYEAAYYFLDQLLTGFDEDKNLENARQMISLGGLNLLVRRMDLGNTFEKSKAVSVLYICIQADGSCRHYLAKNLKKDAIISLLIPGKETNSQRHALALLIELLCLSRRNERIVSLTGLNKGWDCLNTMHILLFHLQRARPEERPIIAVILLQLDLMGDPLGCSVYREEAIDTIVKALECGVFEEKIQEQSARALLILGGHFSYTGAPEVERWLLKKVALHENRDNRHVYLNEEEDKTMEIWQRKVAIVLLTSGNTRLFAALSDSIANSIPCLARASLVTICWMSSGLHCLGDKELQFAAFSIFVPQLIECLNDDRVVEEKTLASFAILCLTKNTGKISSHFFQIKFTFARTSCNSLISDYFMRLSGMERGVLDCLDELSRVTWAAKELISLIENNLPGSYP